MTLFVVGGVDPERLITLIEQDQAAKSFDQQGVIKRFIEQEPTPVAMPKKTAKLQVAQPKCLMGCKETMLHRDGNELLRRELATKIALDLLFSPSSAIYEKLYEQKLISDSFGHEYNISTDYAFSIIGGDTKDPDVLVKTIREEVDAVIASGFELLDFERSRKKKIGRFLRMMNSPEAIANEFTKYRFKNVDLFQILPIYESLKLEEINERIREHFDWDQLSISIVSDQV
jgi:predicted Zn-dependent peptidase